MGSLSKVISEKLLRYCAIFSCVKAFQSIMPFFQFFFSIMESKKDGTTKKIIILLRNWNALFFFLRNSKH